MAETSADIVIVDDDPDIRSALRRLLTAAGHSVRTYGSASEYLAQGTDPEPGCILLDLRLPDLDGIKLYQRLQGSGNTPPVIFLTGYGDIPTSVQAMKSGALDFLPKPVDDEVLMRTVHNALEVSARQRAERERMQEISRRFASLTPREQDVLRLVLAGLLNKQIARELHISEKTVKVHRGRVMAKVGVRRVAQLVQYAVEAGLEAPQNIRRQQVAEN